METLQDLKHKVQEIMKDKNKKASAIDAYTEQLQEKILQLDKVILSLGRAMQLLLDGE